MGWQSCRGLSGSFPVDWVAALPWTGWQLCHGLSGSFPADWAAAFSGICTAICDKCAASLGVNPKPLRLIGRVEACQNSMKCCDVTRNAWPCARSVRAAPRTIAWRGSLRWSIRNTMFVSTRYITVRSGSRRVLHGLQPSLSSSRNPPQWVRQLSLRGNPGCET
jgi:hypothetical protein